MLLFLTPAIGVFSSIIGVALARHLLSVNRIAISTGGLVVCVIAFFYVVSLVLLLKKRSLKKVWIDSEKLFKEESQSQY